MRRKITLYIADQLVDLDDQSFILFNYQMDDLSNPTIVKNSFSQQITLKGTANNNRIFGHYFKTDRRISNTGGDTGTDFNASQKTPFTIYDEMGHILESGYIKLDSISRQRADIQYKVTLYGGLGSFFYALSYDENGNKRNLADLDYLGTDTPETELNFTINKESVRDAWERLMGFRGNLINPVSSVKWQYINAQGQVVATTSQYWVNTYDAVGYDAMLVSGQRYRSSALAVAVDVDGNILQVYGVEGSENVITNYRIDLPSGTRWVYVSAWDNTAEGQTPNVPRATELNPSPMWDVINFAPAYNGIPEGNFSPDKGLIIPSEMGLKNEIPVDDVTYGLKSGYALVNLAEAQDEWAVKDLRSYLQRPVLSMKAFWDAICNPDNNGGYEVDASVIKEFSSFGNYSALWMTLPLISSIGSIKQESGDLTLTMSSTATSGNSVGRFDVSGSVPSGTKVIANLHCKMRWNMPSGANSYNNLSPIASYRNGRDTTSKISAIFIQAVAYGSDDSIVGGSKIKVHGYGSRSLSGIAEQCGFTPAWLADYESMSIAKFTKVSAGVFELSKGLAFTVEAQDVAYYKILVSVYPGTGYASEGSGGNTFRSEYAGTGAISTPVMYADYDTGFTPASTFIVAGTTANTITYTSSESLRSGAAITKAMLLSTSRTPAEYMLSFCKIFGLYFTYDNVTKKVTILRRNDLYQDETIDLTRRVDLSKGVSIKPLVFDAKWYDFMLEGVGGAFYDEYLNVEGIPYGIQRVNTGYDFNADSVNLMESVVFKNAATVLARSKYFNMITRVIPDYPYPTSQFAQNTWYTGTELGGDVTQTTATGCSAINLSVRAGERYRLQTHGGDTGRAWYYLDGDNKIVKMADALWEGVITLTIPSGVSRLIAQTDIEGRLSLTKLGSSAFYPSPFLDKGNTYTLWSPDGETIDTDISCPPNSSTLEYYNENPNYKGYDINSARKLELRSADNKPVDGADILVFHEGWNRYDYFRLTDDVPAMDVVNDGVPCWLLGAGGTGADGLNIPIFQRYNYGNIAVIEDSLDFGVPHQMDIPGVSHPDGCTVYERGWRKYISDRYDVNTKVMTCWVNFAGMQVNQELLRKFYWYDNTLWVLNAIRNYSLTTFDPVECEFVQVQDKSNYLNGQSY